MQQRLQKLLAHAGIASRRECEKLIEAGRVSVDGEVVKQLGSQADPAVNEIRVDGESVHALKRRYYLVNKPKGLICSNADEFGRARAIDLVPEPRTGLYTVGRLDADSEGIIIVTNDGELANQLTHPRYGVAKTYRVEVTGRIEPEEMARLEKGLWSSAGKMQADRVKIVGHTKTRTVLEIVLAEGKNREIRRMLQRLGHKIRRLKRIKIGPLTSERLKRGGCRTLNSAEVAGLRKIASRTPQPHDAKRAKGHQHRD